MNQFDQKFPLKDEDNNVTQAQDVREQALQALRDGRYDLAEEVLARGELNLETVVENLRIYHAELLIQNEELRRSESGREEALARFTTFFNSLPIAELIVDAQGLIMDANPEASRVFALKPTHLHQHFFVRLVDEKDRGQVIQAWSRLDTDQTVVLHALRFLSDGDHFFVGDLHVARLSFERDSRRRFLCAVIDRTEEEKHRADLGVAYQSLRDSEERYRVLAEFSPDWEYWSSADGDFLYISPACEGITGFPAEDFLEDRHLIERLIHEDDRELWREHFNRECGIPISGPQKLELRLFDRNGKLHWIEHVCTPVSGADGRDLGRRGVNRDITERKLAEEARARGEALLRATGRMARVGGWELDAATGQIIWTDSTRDIHEVSETFSPSLAQAIGFFHPHDRDSVHQAIERALREGVEFALEVRLTTARGQALWVKIAGDPVYRDGEGKGGILKLIGSLQDITERIDADNALREHELQYRALFESASEGMSLLAEGRFIKFNQAALRMLGYQDESALIGTRPWEISPATQPDGETSITKAKALVEQALESGSAHTYWDHQRADGGAITVELNLSRIELQGKPAILAAWRDMTDERAAREREVRTQTVFEKTSEGIVFTDAETRILMVNQAFSEITGYSEDEVLGKTPQMLRSGRHDDAFYKAMWTSIEETGSWRGEFWNRRKSGEVYPQQSTISAMHNDAGELTGYIGVFGDLSSLRRSEEALYRLAHHDILTGLPNRALLRASLEQSLARARRSKKLLALLYLDLDLFKNVNETLGHPVGDQLLQQVATAMQKAIGDSCLIARVGGDEFMVVAEDLAEPSVAGRLAARILNCFAEPFSADDRELFITASIGISLFPADGDDIDELQSHADLAMYQAKEHGRNTYRFFEATMTSGVSDRLRLESALRGALARDQLWLAYQPQIALEDETLVGVEALLRWQHPELGLISPGVFIPIAEETGLIREIGDWVLEQGVRQLAQWDRDGIKVPRLAINLAMPQMESPELVAQVRGVLERTGVSANRIELEVTESMLMRNIDQVRANLEALREMGVYLAIDDFGSGYSSLRYLKRLPIHRLKIDRSFVEQLTQDPNDDAIVRAVIVLGRSLGLAVLAEGVETRAQADFLAAEGCHEVQGFLFGRPVPPEEISARLRA
ncbi:PAS domain S-box protein [Thiorhodovibrio frisius]|uniref:cyclic-guanylate-specific phosphodiesterase n=1 Tax=Thiorhodovibrio frisius TaxID=631362 RepID=H8Z5X8_9GAMM|nr:EAL domain-containing protein [Thiorhodovibrio frisius]EIC20628.1 PAS domain S-box/diguanylate cyclase (GGDEF) domain-containing protein [Thiorhodovibrio frisius]WPL21377.1 Bacteriophytochrome cph2 [Thiorhodovibrio frisius]